MEPSEGEQIDGVVLALVVDAECRMRVPDRTRGARIPNPRRLDRPYRRPGGGYRQDLTRRPSDPSPVGRPHLSVATVRGRVRPGEVSAGVTCRCRLRSSVSRPLLPLAVGLTPCGLLLLGEPRLGFVGDPRLVGEETFGQVGPSLAAPTRAVPVDDQANASAADEPCGDVQQLFHGP
jgi:hypothetical protein